MNKINAITQILDYIQTEQTRLSQQKQWITLNIPSDLLQILLEKQLIEIHNTFSYLDQNDLVFVKALTVKAY